MSASRRAAVGQPEMSRQAEEEVRSERNVAVFFTRVGVALVFQSAQGGDDSGAGFCGLNDGVDVAALGGDKGIGEAVAELGNFFAAEGFAPGFGGFLQFALIDDVDGA